MSTYTLTRSFVVEKEVTLETQILRGQIKVNQGFADLSQILEQVGDPDELTFKIYDFSDNRYHKVREYCPEIDESFLVPAQLLRSDIVLMKYVPDASETTSVNSGSQSGSDTSSAKKERSKERTIAEVIEIVKQWRDMHLNSSNGKKVNLQEAAEILGISKKSLDDYYYQLRLGEKYDFDFKNHLSDKVGVLRTFIKDIKPKKKDSRSKLEKHPKKLKIIEQLGEFEAPLPKNKKGSRNSKDSNKEREAEIQAQPERKEAYAEQQADRNSIKSIENQFYNEFEFMGEEPPDPFLNFECDFKKKKNFDEMSEQLFF